MASIGLAPVFALQGRRVHRAMPRLPEPPGPRAGTGGEGPSLRLLLVGDSAAVGVGAESQEEALSGRLVAELAPDFRVAWSVVARSGATAAGTARHLARRPAEECSNFDVAALSLGTNDVAMLRPLNRWLADVSEVVALLRARFGVQHVLLSGLPPMHLFTAFPQPLRWYLGATAKRFNRALAQWASEQPDCEHVPLEATDGAVMLAPDGLHPAPAAYELWSVELARHIRARWTAPPASEVT